MSTVRLRRLAADYQRIQDYVRRHPRVTLVQADGAPPERYQLQYVIRSLKQSNGELVQVDSHMVEIVLPRNYPRTPPQCRMLTPVFHPNIAPHAICVGDHWGAGETLDSIVIRIGEMLAYQSYNVKSPLNGEAARWVEENLYQVPTDKVSLLPEGEAKSTNGDAHVAAPAPSQLASPAPAQRATAVNLSTPQVAVQDGVAPRATAPSVAVPPADRIRVVCPNCQKAYVLGSQHRGRTAKCAQCQTSFTI